MKATTEKVYRCDHCNKAMVSAGFMKVHERMCKHNPANKHACFHFCQHLVKGEAQELDEDTGRMITTGCSFTCAKRPELGEMYSYKAERYKTWAHLTKGKTRMPATCSEYEVDEDHWDFPSPNPDSHGIPLGDSICRRCRN